MKIAYVGVLLVAVSAFAKDRPTYPMNVAAPGVKSITLDVQEGDLVVRGDPAATSIQMKVSIDRFFLFKLGEEGILKKLITVSGENTPQITIRTDIRKSATNWGRAEYPIDFEVVVPASAALHVRDTSGVIEISAMNGAVEIHDTSGTLAVRRIAGPLTIDKESGDIRVADVPNAVKIASRSGQMRLERVGELEVTSSDGNLDVAGARAARLTNKGGNITVKDVKGDLVIDDDSGEIDVRDVAGRVTIRDTSGQIRASNTGPMVVDDTSGDVVVNGAASLEVRAKEGGQVKVSAMKGDVHVPPGITLSRK